MSWNPFDWWERRKLAKKLVIAIDRRHDELGLSDSERTLRWAAFTDNVHDYSLDTNIGGKVMSENRDRAEEIQLLGNLVGNRPSNIDRD